ncbi:MAG TPA: hypothetical protein VFG22_08000 [Polyangiales bacterium]|jgi:hypothetical protein|nr:hypothetical protein [Polyangiales bacterium]
MGEIDWSPTIGDPTLMGWLTVLAYFVTAWLCLRAFNTEKRGPKRPYRQTIPALLRVLRKSWPEPPILARRAALWLFLAIVFVCLGINKQLDLQSLLTQVGRTLAHQQGWYDQRRLAQAILVGVVLIAGVAALATLGLLVRGQLSDFRLPLAGLTFIVVFVVIRATSFYHVDRLIGFELRGVRMNWVLELTGIGIVAVGAIRRQRRGLEP